jgi:protein-tyrosine phosphatase
MAALGARTVVSLRTESEAAEEERKAVTASGLRYIRIGLPGLGRPPDEPIREILQVITSAGNQPVLVHCKRGADRTGVAVACYRIGHEGWSVDQAMAEAKEHGLGWWQFGMKRFIRDSCGDALKRQETE